MNERAQLDEPRVPVNVGVDVLEHPAEARSGKTAGTWRRLHPAWTVISNGVLHRLLGRPSRGAGYGGLIAQAETAEGCVKPGTVETERGGRT